MRTLLMILVAKLIACSTAFCQSNYNEFYDKYRDQEDVATFEFSTSLFKFLLDEEDRDDVEKDFGDKINRISFISTDSEKLLKKVKNDLPTKNYHDIMEVKKNKSTVTFKAKEHKKGISEILMTVTAVDNVFVMCIAGDFDFDDARKLVDSINVDNAQGAKD